LHGRIEAAGVQSYGGGIERYTVDPVEPVLRYGVLLDWRLGSIADPQLASQAPVIEP
jgi:hypothetical protein